MENGEPYQYVVDYHPYRIELKDFTERGKKKLYEWDSMQTQAPMPLIDSDLFYFALMKLDEHRGWIYVKFHHIISDGAFHGRFRQSGYGQLSGSP